MSKLPIEINSLHSSNDHIISIVDEETSGPLAQRFIDRSLGDAKVFVGICIYSPLSNYRYLKEYIPWVLSHASRTLIVIGDYVERYNDPTWKKGSEEIASKKVLARGRKIRSGIERVLKEFPEYMDCVQIGNWYDDILTYEFKKIHHEVVSAYQSDLNFQKDVDVAVLSYLNSSRRAKDLRLAPNYKSREASCAYILEEISYFIFTILNDYYIEVYPGKDMRIMRKISEGSYKSLNYDLTKRTHVSIQVPKLES
ncbi:MAG: tRNA-dependent cyclodipeptide synthase [Candidatus Thiodiazotropha endolucinida]|nr:tRNA-dependent cyclodipeptide synthase [Candidatus Thiodiazotropha endolucinida]